MVRAGNRCEYCGLHQDDWFLVFQVDHIRSQKHKGTSDENNLALSCPPCNRNKGSDIATLLDGDEETAVRLFNPRKMVWSEHFEFEDTGVIFPKPT